MPITDNQRARRINHLGASDLPAILGLSPWASAYDVWLEKTGRVEPKPTTTAMRAGNLLEDGILAYAEDELGPIVRNQRRVHPELPIAANIDAILRDYNQPLEAKKVDYWNPSFDAWGEPGSDQIPEDILIQVHVQMMCLDHVGESPDRAHVSALIGGRLALYHVRRNQDLCNIIADKAAEFWTLNVLAEDPPAVSDVNPDLIRRVTRTEGLAVAVDPAIFRAVLEAKAATKAAKDAEEQAVARMFAGIDDAEIADGGTLGQFRYALIQQNRVNLAKLEVEHPEIAEAYREESSYRKLIFKQAPKPKKGNQDATPQTAD